MPTFFIAFKQICYLVSIRVKVFCKAMPKTLINTYNGQHNEDDFHIFKFCFPSSFFQIISLQVIKEKLWIDCVSLFPCLYLSMLCRNHNLILKVVFIVSILYDDYFGNITIWNVLNFCWKLYTIFPT